MKNGLKYFFGLFFLIVFCSCNHYKKGISTKAKQFDCSEIIRSESYYWKKDSLPSNGYRMQVVNNFKNCKLNNLKTDIVLHFLGKPNRKLEYEYEDHVEYTLIYNYFDYKYVSDKIPESPYGNSYIAFIYHSSADTIVKIYFGSQDY